MFRPTNPMIAGILSLLAELHSLKGLKINNVFCIELVFKAFSIVAEDVKPTDMLRKVRAPRGLIVGLLGCIPQVTLEGVLPVLYPSLNPQMGPHPVCLISSTEALPRGYPLVFQNQSPDLWLFMLSRPYSSGRNT